MKVLIIEDEPRAAHQLESLLQSCGFQYELLAILDTVEDSIEWLKRHRQIDLIFMDVQLADGLSFEIFQNIEVEAPIIFTTAFDQYAIQAFKVNSIDYLLKPIQKKDLLAALEKFKKSKEPKVVDPAVLRLLLSSMQAEPQREGILVKEGSGFVQVKVEDLLYMYSEDSLTFGVTTDKRYIIDETLDQLYSSLNRQKFFKINRSQVIAKKSIRKIEPYLNHRVKLSIESPRDQEFVVSRQKTSEFKNWINQ